MFTWFLCRVGAGCVSFMHSVMESHFLPVAQAGAWHGPEIAYLVDGYNGMMLSGDTESDVQRVARMLLNGAEYEKYCENAYNTAHSLSVERWCEQVCRAFATGRYAVDSIHTQIILVRQYR